MKILDVMLHLVASNHLQQYYMETRISSKTSSPQANGQIVYFSVKS